MPERVFRIWTRDLQIFSLTLSQLSYLGSHANIKNNVKETEEIRKRNNEHKQLKETFLLTEGKRVWTTARKL